MKRASTGWLLGAQADERSQERALRRIEAPERLTSARTGRVVLALAVAGSGSP